MTERIYLIAVDARNTTHDVSAVKACLANTPAITNWWNYIPHVFLMVSSISLDETSEAISPYTKDASLPVIELNPDNSEGMLQESAWQGLQRRESMPATTREFGDTRGS